MYTACRLKNSTDKRVSWDSNITAQWCYLVLLVWGRVEPGFWVTGDGFNNFGRAGSGLGSIFRPVHNLTRFWTVIRALYIAVFFAVNSSFCKRRRPKKLYFWLSVAYCFYTSVNLYVAGVLSAEICAAQWFFQRLGSWWGFRCPGRPCLWFAPSIPLLLYGFRSLT